MQRRSNKGGLCFVVPKTAKSRRTIMLGTTAVAALRAQHDQQVFARQRDSSHHWIEQDLVFPNETGRPLDPSWQTAVFKAAAQAAKLPPIRFHDLRHTAATLLLAQGVHPKIVAEMLGHTSIAITLDTYSHLVPVLHAQAASAMDALLGA